MSRKVTIKSIKIHMQFDGLDIVKDANVAISYKNLKFLGAKGSVK